MEVKQKQFVEYRVALQEYSSSKGEPEWMLQLRLKALNQIDELPLPKIERVTFNRWPLFEVPVLDTRQPPVAADASQWVEEKEETARIVQTGTQTLMKELPQELAEKGVVFTDLFTAMKKVPELVKEAYMQYAVHADEHKLTAFHAAFMNNGVFLYVPKNIVIEAPIEGVYIQDSTTKQSFVQHVLIYADTNSEFTYVEKYLTEGEEKNTANIVVEVVAKPGSRVKFSAVDQLSKHTTTYFNRRGYLLKDASIDWALGVMNEGNVIADFDSELVGDGSHSDVKAVAISTGRQIQAVDTRVTNYGKHSVGHIFQHGVILDRATLTFNGIGHIIKGGKGADAQQESRVLMLSDKARGDANPILLIDENEVTAGHAASVGRVDPEEMYYLMSRGIEEEEAKRLVIRGFLGAVISAIPLKEVRDELVATIERKLVS